MTSASRSAGRRRPAAGRLDPPRIMQDTRITALVEIRKAILVVDGTADSLRSPYRASGVLVVCTSSARRYYALRLFNNVSFLMVFLELFLKIEAGKSQITKQENAKSRSLDFSVMSTISYLEKVAIPDSFS